MKFIDFFAGIGGFRLGLEMAGHECVGFCEYDKFAVASYRAMHDTEGEWYGKDIRVVRASELPRSDIWCFGFPCQDISVAGKQTGFKGNRSSLFFAVTRLIRDTEEEDRPSILFIENVKNLLSVNGGWDFAKLLIELDEIGYDAEWQVLNSKDFGVPQNRERVFIIGHLRGRSRREVFPIRRTDEATDVSIKIIAHRNGYRRNTQVFEPTGITEALDTGQGGGRGHYTVIDKSYNNPRAIDVANCITSREDRGISNHKAEGTAVICMGNVNPIGKGVAQTITTSPNQAAIIDDTYKNREPREYTDNAPTLRADRHGLMVKEATKNSCDSAIKQYEKFISKNGYIPEMFNPYNCSEITDIAPTLTACCDRVNASSTILKREDFRIRKLTPKECFRLQGWPDEYFEKAKSVNSDSQLYKQAGNGVTVNVIYEIAKRLGS